jgi:hypothetical protein
MQTLDEGALVHMRPGLEVFCWATREREGEIEAVCWLSADPYRLPR